MDFLYCDTQFAHLISISFGLLYHVQKVTLLYSRWIFIQRYWIRFFALIFSFRYLLRAVSISRRSLHVHAMSPRFSRAINVEIRENSVAKNSCDILDPNISACLENIEKINNVYNHEKPLLSIVSMHQKVNVTGSSHFIQLNNAPVSVK